jgi:wobble nucleotide-excising tRNase
MAQEFFSVITLNNLAKNIRESGKKVTLLFAYNGAGKTRLSMDFKELGKAAGEADTLYFNAFTEDLFWWNNDLENDTERFLNINKNSRFFEGLETIDIANRIRQILNKYGTFNFDIDFNNGRVVFFREIVIDGNSQVLYNIKVSRGEENIFYWCFFLAVAQLAIDKEDAYNWVKYIYVDDPISSLDDNNALVVAHRLAMLLKTKDSDVKAIISTHHALFFNVMCNEFSNPRMLFLKKTDGGYQLKSTHDAPFIYHISMIQELKKVIASGNLYTYHFSILRNILEKAANFHGFRGFKDCMIIENDDEDGTLHHRMVSNLNHGGYSLFEPIEMGDENKLYFKQIFENYLNNYKFNSELFFEPQSTPVA